MNKSTLILTVGIIILIVGGIVLFTTIEKGDTTNTPSANGNDGEDNGNGDGSASLPENWKTYTSNTFDFSLKHPPEVTAQVEAERTVKFQLIGPESEPSTEITDGFTFWVTRHTLSDNESLRALAQKEHDEALAIGTSIQNVTQTTFRGETAYTYKIDSLGETTYLVVLGGNSTAYVLSYTVADPNNVGYRPTITGMVSTFMRHDIEGTGGSDVSAPLHNSVRVALLDREGTSDGKERGCDRVVLIERDVTPTRAPLTAALRELFSFQRETVSGWHNFLAKTNDTLSFDRATVSNGTARIYLKGELSGLAGVCDNPRAKIQIEETALQFSTVERVELFLNGEQTELSPSERGA